MGCDMNSMMSNMMGGGNKGMGKGGGMGGSPMMASMGGNRPIGNMGGMSSNMGGRGDKGCGKGAFNPKHQDGDWYCPNCGDHQFSRNIKCRQCSTPKPTEEEQWEEPFNGDWYCPNPNCKDYQFARNTQCRKCGEPNPNIARRGSSRSRSRTRTSPAVGARAA